MYSTPFQESTEQDVEARLGKARTVYRAIDKWWKTKIIGRAAKVTIFNSIVKAVLLYASESRTTTQRMTDRPQVFINKGLRRILNIHWPDRTANKELWDLSCQEPVLDQPY